MVLIRLIKKINNELNSFKIEKDLEKILVTLIDGKGAASKRSL